MASRSVLAVVSILLACGIAGALGKRAEGLTYKTFRSPPISLRSGQIANTMGNWGPLEWVPGPIGIRHFNGRIVDETGRLVPLTEVYVHHWVIYRYDKTRQFLFPNGGVCSNLPNIFGIGAELYYTEYDYPAPYAVMSTGEEAWTANMHLIRTTNVPDVQSCIECHCPTSRPPQQPFGGIQCCPDQAMCWGMENSTLQDAKNYYLQYTIGYVNVTKDVVPLTLFSMDVTSTHNNDCQTEYQIPAVAPGQTNVLETLVEVPNNLSVVYIEGHQHVGGVNFTLTHMRNGKSIGEICTTRPTYGTGSGPGNESGYIVGIAPCHFDPPYKMLQGDKIKLHSVYDSRAIPGGHPWHEGVMGLVFMAAVAKLTPQQTCLEMLHVFCGIPPYYFSKYCYSCAQYFQQDLINAGCTADMIANECNQTSNGTSVIPTPAGVDDVYLQLNTDEEGTRTWANLTGPAGSWFGFGINTNSSDMLNAIAWTYSTTPTHRNGVPTVQQRLLGNHASGRVINPNFPANITILPSGLVQALFDLTGSSLHTHFAAAVTAPKRPHMMGVERGPDGGLHPLVASGPANELPYTCFLFARGKDSTDLGYHGASRGWSCQVHPPPPPPPPPPPAPVKVTVV
eukprot:m.225645 g.225645  ORF g.225645 m.225645 type:complete len:621 (-) comp16751_c0_seq1:205-2067(-)